MNLSQLARAIAANLTAFADAQDASPENAPDLSGDPLVGAAAPAPAAEGEKRKPGRPRKNPETAPAQEALDLGTPAGDGDPLAGMAPPAAPTPPPAPAAPDEAALHVAIRELVAKHGPAAGHAIVKRAGVAALKDIPAKHYAAVIKACQIETAKPVKAK